MYISFIVEVICRFNNINLDLICLCKIYFIFFNLDLLNLVVFNNKIIKKV